MLQRHPHRLDVRELPLVVVHPTIGSKVAILMSFHGLLEQSFRLRLQKTNPVQRNVIALDANMLLAGHTFALLLARCHGVVVYAHTIERCFGRSQPINPKLLIRHWLTMLDALEQRRGLHRKQPTGSL